MWYFKCIILLFKCIYCESHLNTDIIAESEGHEIHYAFFPSNSTHYTNIFVSFYH